jgi:hypothetical protein
MPLNQNPTVHGGSIKTALMFVDDGAIKVAFGQSLKCVKFGEVSKDYNARFFEKLFAEASVFVVDNAEQMTQESFAEYVSGLSGTEQATAGPASEVQAPAGHVQEKRQTAAPNAAPKRAGSQLFRSTAQTYIIVEDLPVGDSLRGTEAKRYLSLPPNKAINLSVLDQEAVRNSSILKGLISDGTLVPCSSQEAMELERGAATAALDSRDDQWSPMIPADVKAEDFASQSSSKGMIGASDMHEAATINVGSETEPEYDPSRPLTMEQMMSMTGASDDSPPPVYSEPRPRRQLAARPTVAKTGIKPKPIAR